MSHRSSPTGRRYRVACRLSPRLIAEDATANAMRSWTQHQGHAAQRRVAHGSPGLVPEPDVRLSIASGSPVNASALAVPDLAGRGRVANPPADATCVRAQAISCSAPGAIWGPAGTVLALRIAIRSTRHAPAEYPLLIRRANARFVLDFLHVATTQRHRRRTTPAESAVDGHSRAGPGRARTKPGVEIGRASCRERV